MSMKPLPPAVRLVGALAAAMLLLGTAVGHAARPRLVVDRGIVQAATANGVTLRELDGGVVTIPVNGSTRIVLNGAPAQIQDVQPGFVAATFRSGSGAALIVRVVGRVKPVRHLGTILSVGAEGLVLDTAQGQVTATFAPSTQVLLDGRQAAPQDLRPGMRAAVLQLRSGQARAVRAVSPRLPKPGRSGRTR